MRLQSLSILSLSFVPFILGRPYAKRADPEPPTREPVITSDFPDPSIIQVRGRRLQAPTVQRMDG